MKYLSNNRKMLERLFNKQFEMIGVPVTLESCEQWEREREEKKKGKPWWEVYYWPDVDMWNGFINWASGELERVNGVNVERELLYFEWVYGMRYRWPSIYGS